MKMTLLLVVILVGCASTQKIDGHTFSKHEAFENANLPVHGFLKTDRQQNICGHEPIIKGGYYVVPRKPRSGETESEYRRYLNAEEARVRLCAKASLWCSTELNIFCRADDEKCKEERGPGAARSICKIKPNDNSDGLLSPVLDRNIEDRWIICGTKADEFTSPLSWMTTTNKAFLKDRKSWVKFCEQHRPTEECNAILNSKETSSYFVEPDAGRWIIDTLVADKPTVNFDDEIIYSTLEIDASPSCEMMEERH